jgi:hypothetical protein
MLVYNKVNTFNAHENRNFQFIFNAILRSTIENNNYQKMLILLLKTPESILQ